MFPATMDEYEKCYGFTIGTNHAARRAEASRDLSSVYTSAAKGLHSKSGKEFHE